MATRPAASSLAEELALDALADNTRNAYAKDLRRYEVWGGSIPSSVDQVVAYLAENRKFAASTLKRWIASISREHQRLHAFNPCSSLEVRDALKGINKKKLKRPRQVAPAERDEVLAMVRCVPDTLTGTRDRALLLIGFSGAMRRSELVALLLENVTFESRGALLTLGQTKTHAANEVVPPVAIPRSPDRDSCPVVALQQWMRAAKLWKNHDGARIAGPVFRRISKAGNVHADALNDASIARLIKAYALKAGLDPSLYSGHSLRRGLATTAAKEGKLHHKIKAQTRHKTDSMVAAYIDDNEIFKDNAADVF